MRIYILVILYFLLIGNTAIKNQRPTPESHPIEEINPSPNPTPVENESEVFRGSTINHRARQEEKDPPVKEQKSRKHEQKKKGY